VDCAAEGRAVDATEVDHEDRHRGDPAIFWDESRWRQRCKPHHSEKTAREVGFGRQ
jgi:5-methylcytosine-specific restriction protein A